MTGDWFESAISVTSLMRGSRQRVIEILKSSFRSKENRMRKWTFMVYMAADDVVANVAVESLRRVKFAFSAGIANDDVIVKAQLGVERSEQTPVFRRYIFSHQTPSSQNKSYASQNWENLLTASYTGSGSINANAVLREKDEVEIDMTDPKELEDFINWAYDKEEDRSYCLIFWGHGTELLYEAPERSKASKDGTSGKINTAQKPAAAPPSGNGEEKKKRLYFNPVQLRDALKDTRVVTEGKLKIIGMDACAMSTIEFAYELKDLADFMVASQENVPDPSFPYTNLMELFQKSANNPEELCRSAVKAYVHAYWDYFPDPGAVMKPVTLSALRLRAEAY